MRRIESIVGENIYWLIRNAELTERELAREIGSSQSYINKLKNGRLKLSSLDVIHRLSRSFGISMEDLLDSDFSTKKPIRYLGVNQWENCKVFVLQDTPLGPQPSFVNIEELSKEFSEGES